MIRTMELILGLPPLSQYDAAAHADVQLVHRHKADPTPYNAIVPRINLDAATPKRHLAAQSKKMDFSEYDLAPEDELNRILWYAAKGLDADYPTPIHRAIHVQ